MTLRAVIAVVLLWAVCADKPAPAASFGYCPDLNEFSQASENFDEDNPLQVGTKFSPPFVMGSKGELEGLSIELWKNIAGCLGLSEDDYEFVEYGTVEELIEATEVNEVDAAIAALSISAEREARVDFSQAYFRTSLGVLVADRSDVHNFQVLLERIFQSNVVNIILGLLAFMVFVAVVYWLLERRSEDHLFSKGPLRGLYSSLIWTALLVFQGRGSPFEMSSRFGQLTVLLLVFLGVSVISGFTAVITSNLTLQGLQPEIRTLADLDNKNIAVRAQSAAAAWAGEQGLFTERIQTFSQAQRRFDTAAIDLLIHDRPILQYMVANNLLENVQLAPLTMNPQFYGIAFPNGSPLREPVNRAVLTITENDIWDTMRKRHVGGS